MLLFTLHRFSHCIYWLRSQCTRIPLLIIYALNNSWVYNTQRIWVISEILKNCYIYSRWLKRKTDHKAPFVGAGSEVRDANLTAATRFEPASKAAQEQETDYKMKTIQLELNTALWILYTWDIFLLVEISLNIYRSKTTSNTIHRTYWFTNIMYSCTLHTTS